MDNALSLVDHIIVLMFENRSFDNLLGALYPSGKSPNGDPFDGLPLTSVNYVPVDPPNQTAYPVWTDSPAITWDSMTIPNPDPGELFVDMNQQIFGAEYIGPPPHATMSGFANDYHNCGGSPSDIMHYFGPPQTPVFSALAQQYAVCDQWFGSCPTQTFANRMFLMCGSSFGYIDDTEFAVNHSSYANQPSIFSQLDKLSVSPANPNWKIYRNGYFIAGLLLDYFENPPALNQVVDISEFANDVKNSTLPPFSLIEPLYSATSALGRGNSYHPPASVADGELLLWQIYTTLQSNQELFNNTLLIVTFDEHGGCYDHVPPQKALAPSSNLHDPFNRYGPRVPTVLVSPLISAGQVYRASTPKVPVLDHTSIIRTVFDRFLPAGSSLQARDAIAPSCAGALDITAGNYNPGITIPQPQTPAPPSGYQAARSALDTMVLRMGHAK